MIQNAEIASRLEEVADLLENQRANPFRVEAYRKAAGGIRHLTQPLSEIYRAEGDAGLRAVTGVGERLGTMLRTLLTTGRLPMLDRLRGETDPAELLESVPGIGATLADRLQRELGIDSLEDLETAAHDGRLTDLAGVGKKKLAGIVATMAARLGRVRSQGRLHDPDLPPVEELLDIDGEYREQAAAGRLPTIAPRRFNPLAESWLPILHTHRGERQYTALYSNTAKAQEFDRTHDWVVLSYDGGVDERQATVVTSHRGVLSGRRVVRGREPECEEFYLHSSGSQRAS